MKKLALIVLMAAGFVIPASAALTADEREFDLRLLAGNYARYYAPYEWKRDNFGFDLMKIGPWVARARAASSDVEFWDICAEYVASLNDSHAQFFLPSNFVADLGFRTDIYDGKMLVDFINRTLLPANQYNLAFGWELVSIDGTPAVELQKQVMKLLGMANERSRARNAARYVTLRPQTFLPRAHEVPDTSTVVLRDLQGKDVTFSMKWNKSGAPVTDFGNTPYPNFLRSARPTKADKNELHGSVEVDSEENLGNYEGPLSGLRNAAISEPSRAVLNLGATAPIYPLPTGFQARRSDYFTTGTFTANGLRLGLIRIPTFIPSSTAAALRQFQAEIAFYQANTDGLVIDVMRNGGGSLCYAFDLLRSVIPYQFPITGLEIRATGYWVSAFSQQLEALKAANAPQWQITAWEQGLKAVRDAYAENRGRTGPLPICDPTLTYLPSPAAYTKPVMLLIDDFSFSAADIFPAIFQDAKRGPLFGYRTNGAGGSVTSLSGPIFSESSPNVTMSLVVRNSTVNVPGFPATNYIENVGVQPDIEYDIQTRENLMNGYRPFTNAFVDAMVKHVQSQPR